MTLTWPWNNIGSTSRLSWYWPRCPTVLLWSHRQHGQQFNSAIYIMYQIYDTPTSAYMTINERNEKHMSTFLRFRVIATTWEKSYSTLWKELHKYRYLYNRISKNTKKLWTRKRGWFHTNVDMSLVEMAINSCHFSCPMTGTFYVIIRNM